MENESTEKSTLADRELNAVSGGYKVIEHITRTEIRCKNCGEIFDYTTALKSDIKSSCNTVEETVYACPNCHRWLKLSGELS